MSDKTIDELRDMLVAAAGQGESDLRGDISDVLFDDLGYDSLALLETAALVKQEWGVHIPDDQVTEFKTPGALLAWVNGAAVDVH